ncbi:RNA-binding S4 domain-containing protein [Aureicoccus marinus]|uniref:RNA-binding protein n=1 Tax=Aureicoccus marinus TaxID=754435 RepID=A0A2S7T6F7_9FLAO|nr:S4 domain-containing protein [Aureicoccus marinus]PQJ15499.1 RNA-binding protein [Aureicoccus marinus]
MRIDKFLWCTRYFKTRNQATTACKKGLIKVNEQVVKPSREIFPQDKIELRKDQVEMSLTVLEIPASRVSAKQTGLYRLDTTSAEAFQHREIQLLAREHYRKKGMGRPTKKDRRDIDEYLEEGEPNTEREH